MKWTDEQMKKQYQALDMDPTGVLQQQIREQIGARRTSFQRKTVWGLCSAMAMAALVAVAVWQGMAQRPTYLPNPREFDRMQFAFYRELALPGQDLGISYEQLSTHPYKGE